MMPGDEPDAAAICRAWRALLLRGALLLPFFAENLLSVSASGVARELRFRRADALGRYLMANRLPPSMLFRNGIYVVQLLENHERGVRLSQWANARGHYASAYSHFIHKVTGATWTDVIAQGSVRRKAIELRSWASHIDEVDG